MGAAPSKEVLEDSGLKESDGAEMRGAMLKDGELVGSEGRLEYAELVASNPVCMAAAVALLTGVTEAGCGMVSNEDELRMAC